MRRSLTLLWLLTIISPVFYTSSVRAASGSFVYGPYLQNVSQDSITIMWVTDNMVTASVKYSTDISYSSVEYGTCIAESGVYICKVRLTGLDTETTYNYIAYSGETASEEQSLRTSPYRNTDFGFCVWGDSQQEVSASNSIFSGMCNSNTDFALSVGDIVQNPNWSYTQNPFLKYTLDRLGRVKPIFIGYGNHDGGTSSIVRKFTEQPTTLNYTFTYGNAHYTVLDFADYGGGWVSYVPTAWVEAALSSEEAQSAMWRFVVVHVAPYSERWIDGSSILRDDLVPLMEEYGVDMVFSGHTHEYERGYKNGIYYVISGCGSYLDTSEPIVKDWEHMTVGGAQDIAPFAGGLAHGYTEIQINGNKLELKQHGYYSNGTYYGIIDTIDITKVLFESDFNIDGKVDYNDLCYITNGWTSKLSVDIYLGQNFDDVNDATNLSQYYMGNFSTNSYQPNNLEPNNTYYWRVDEIDVNGMQKGQTWQFSTGEINSNMGWWRLDGNANDLSGLDNNGIVYGEPGIKNDANWSSCFSFDGNDDYIQIENEAQFDFTNNITLSAWVYLGSDEEGVYTIASKGNSYWLYYDGYAESIIFYNEGLGRPAQSSTDICDGQWHHIAAVYDGSERAIYIDGIKDASKATSTAMQLNDEHLLIGKNSVDEDENNFKGLIREFRIYSSRLSDEEIVWLSKTKNFDPRPFNGQADISCNSELVFYPHLWMNDKLADINGDFVINFEDFIILAQDWLK